MPDWTSTCNLMLMCQQPSSRHQSKQGLPVSLPRAATHCEAATAAAEPPEDPPGTRSGSQGLQVTYKQPHHQAVCTCFGSMPAALAVVPAVQEYELDFVQSMRSMAVLMLQGSWFVCIAALLQPNRNSQPVSCPCFQARQP